MVQTHRERETRGGFHGTDTQRERLEAVAMFQTQRERD